MAQARLTHNHPFSDSATMDLGRLLRLQLQGANQATCQQWVAQWVERNAVFRFTPYKERATAYVVDTVQTVLHFFTRHESFEAAMVATVNQGDDADTTGALLSMLSGARFGAARLPLRWLERLQPATVQAITTQTKGLLALSHALKIGPANRGTTPP
jgi:ADP-ribosyl-[dinitrogen reductase] hydrolase